MLNTGNSNNISSISSCLFGLLFNYEQIIRLLEIGNFLEKLKIIIN